MGLPYRVGRFLWGWSEYSKARLWVALWVPWVGLWVGAPAHHLLSPDSQNPLGARVREGQRVPMGSVLSDQMVLPDIAPAPWVLGPGSSRPPVPAAGARPLPHSAPAPACEVTSGEAEFNVTLDAIVTALGVAPQELRGEGLQLALTVINDEGGEAVRQQVGVKLVDTPWALDLGFTPRFFVPGAPFLLRGRVLDASGTAAPGVGVQVGVRVTGATAPPPIQLQSDLRGDILVPINVPSGASELSLSVEAGSPGSPPVRAQLTVTPVTPVSGRFLLLEGPGGPLRPGDLLRLQLRDVGPPPAPQIYHLLAVARGRLVAARGVRRGTVTEVTLPVTPAMAPRLRLVAFFQAEGQLVAASWGVPVVSSCHSQVRVEVGRRGSPLRPQTPLKVTGRVTLPGAPVATLALAATDAALLELEPRHRLRPAQVDTVLGSSDLGCGSGGGPDAKEMFRAAGLVFGGPDPPPGPPPGCPPTPHRPRRSSKLLGLLETGAPQGNDTVLGRCCRDGGVTLPLQVTCSQRAQRVPEAGGCRVAFLRCCRRARARRRRGWAAGVARTLFPELEQDWGEEDIPTRSFFPESWMWRSVTANATTSFTVLLPDSITTWEIQAIAVIPSHGLCVAVAQRVTVTQELYVALQLPPSTHPHEQLQLLPHIHSRLPHGINVTVTLAVAEGVCAGLDGTPRRLEVPPGGAVALPLTLVALRPGDVPITVTARGPWGLGDSITRVLHVEPEGELHLEENSYVLDTDGKEGRTLEIPGDIPDGIIPNGEFSISIRVTGRVGGWTMRGALGTGAMLLRSPRGCGEQALMALAPRAAALRYLDHSGGWRALPPDSRPRGLRGLQRGFERVQNFRKSDGSYSAWQHRGGSTWLTALVLRVLALARPYLPLAAGGPGTSLRWLLGQQRPDGTFRESEPVLHREMQGSVADPGPEATVSLTAFVVVALQGARVLLPSDSPDHPLLDEALSRAATFLRGHVETLGTFGTAITTYALALGDTAPPGPSPTLERLRRLARPAQGGRAQFWPAGGPAATVEATGYGLLALLQLRDGAGAARAARWLREQSNYGGGFRSTQDTLVALEALAQMWLQWGDAAGSGLSLGLSWPGGARGTPGETRVTLGPGLQSLEKELQAPLGSPITVRVEGHGEGTLMVLRQFRLMSPLNGSCQGLGLEVAITGPIIYEEEDYEDDEEEAELEEEAEPVNGTESKWMEPNEEAEPVKGVEPDEAPAPLLPPRREGRDPARDVAFLVCIWREAGVELSGMAVAEISLLSGFRPHQGDLDKLRDVVDRWISHYELSGTRLVLYLDQVPTQRQCLSFGATQEVAVGQLQPAMAAIYDYYEPARRCTVFYSAPRRSSAIPALCSSQACLCAQGVCPRLRGEGSLSADDRLDFACYSPRVTYALLIRILDQSEAGPFLAFEMEILEVLLGEVVAGAQGRLLVRGSCPLRLRPQRRFLLMGGEGTAAGTSQSPQFLLGPHSWLEEAPPRPHCGPAPSCPPLLEFMETLRSRGCPF